MTGETNLDTLLKDLRPSLSSVLYVFCTVEGGRYGDLPHTEPLASIREDEGLTLVLPKDQADGAELAYEGIFRCITLTVYSSLEAVGLTAAVARVLAEHGICANVLAGYHHDHVLVPEARAEDALALLSPEHSG